MMENKPMKRHVALQPLSREHQQRNVSDSQLSAIEKVHDTAISELEWEDQFWII